MDVQKCKELRQLCWASLMSSIDEIARISEHGPNLMDQDDEELVKAVFSIVHGELNYHIYASNQN